MINLIIPFVSMVYTADSEWIVMNASAYCSCRICCGANAKGITKTGHKLKPGDKVVAVDPKIIPLGTHLFVEGMGEYRALDIGGAIKGNKIDIWFESHKEALKFGRKNLRVKILNK